MAYNWTLLENATDPVTLINVANTFTNGILGTALLLFIGAASYFFLRSVGYERTRESLASSFIVTFITSTIFLLIGILDNTIWAGCLVLGVLGVVMLISRD